MQRLGLKLIAGSIRPAVQDLFYLFIYAIYVFVT